MENIALFLDDDPVIRLIRISLQNEVASAEEKWAVDYFRPEQVTNPLETLRSIRQSFALPPIEPVLVSEKPMDEILKLGKNVSAIIFRRGEITPELLLAAPNLRIVQHFGSASTGIKVNISDFPNIHFCGFPRYTLAATAEHAILLMLALGKRLLEADAHVRSGFEAIPGFSGHGGVTYNWAGMNSLSPLFGKTLGILGLGEVGYQVAVRAKGMGMKVLYHQRRPLLPDKEKRQNFDYCSFEQLLAQSDFFSVHITPPKDGCPVLREPEFAQMKKGAFLINTSRGTTIDHKALVNALSKGHLGGAGLDVFEKEPLGFGDALTKLPNVILTPHIAGGLRSMLFIEVYEILKNLMLALTGKRPNYTLDQEEVVD